ncbi:CPBP family intramembrane metalloprotease [bacterium]|nr:CPBP family intramembrane metalloprotease [bacterium]
MKVVSGLFFLLFLIVGVDRPLVAMSRLGCLGAGVAEVWVPGLGYVISRQWDKAIVFGTSRLITSSLAYSAYESEYYQDDPDDIYQTVKKEHTESGKTETRIYLTRETWDADTYSSLNFNLLLTSWGDLYQHSCQANTETYDLMLSPFRFDHFYRKPAFWVPFAFLIANYAYFYKASEEESDERVRYFLSRGLKESDLKRDSFPKYYMVGVGEEMFFRGTLQHYFFETLQDVWGVSPSVSRHLSIVGASALFAAGHNGTGFTADSFWAFLFGIYEGYVYHPSLESFDLMTAIAIHSWWDILITYAILSNAEFNESQARVRVPLVSVGFRY